MLPQVKQAHVFQRGEVPVPALPVDDDLGQLGEVLEVHGEPLTDVAEVDQLGLRVEPADVLHVELVERDLLHHRDPGQHLEAVLAEALLSMKTDGLVALADDLSDAVIEAIGLDEQAWDVVVRDRYFDSLDVAGCDIYLESVDDLQGHVRSTPGGR